MFFKKLIYSVLVLQEKFLKFRLAKTIGVKNSSKRKKHFIDGCTLDLNTMAETEKEKLEEEITLILKKYNYEPEQILNYIKNQGTEVYNIQNSSKTLNPIGENEGFILPARGCKAIYLALLTSKKLKLNTPEMFILPNGDINKYYFIYHFYNWYAYKHNITGLDFEAQNLLKKYLFTNADTRELQLAEIYKLKDAIKQDKAAIEFVVKLCRNYDGAKQALNKLKNEGGAKL